MDRALDQTGAFILVGHIDCGPPPAVLRDAHRVGLSMGRVEQLFIYGIRYGQQRQSRALPTALAGGVSSADGGS